MRVCWRGLGGGAGRVVEGVEGAGHACVGGGRGTGKQRRSEGELGQGRPRLASGTRYHGLVTPGRQTHSPMKYFWASPKGWDTVSARKSGSSGVLSQPAGARATGVASGRRSAPGATRARTDAWRRAWGAPLRGPCKAPDPPFQPGRPKLVGRARRTCQLHVPLGRDVLEHLEHRDVAALVLEQDAEALRRRAFAGARGGVGATTASRRVSAGDLPGARRGRAP